MNATGLTYHEWEKDYLNNEIKLNIVNEDEETAEKIVKTNVINETMEKVRKLCRICSSMGLISIHTSMRKCRLNSLVNWTPSGDPDAWDVPISQIIENISGEKVNYSTAAQLRFTFLFDDEISDKFINDNVYFLIGF